MIRGSIILRSTRGGVGGHQQSVIQYHFHIPTLELLTAVNALSSNYEYKLNHNVFSTFSQAWNAVFGPFGLFHKSKWQIFLSFHILLPVKSLPFHTPEVWKGYSFLAQPPRIGHYWEYPPPPPREEALSFVLWFSVFINTVLPLYYYKVSSGSWRPVRSARWVNINKIDFNPSRRLPFLLRGHSSGSFQQLINVVYNSKHITVFCERKPVLLIRNTRLTLSSVPPSYYAQFRTLCTF